MDDLLGWHKNNVFSETLSFGLGGRSFTTKGPVVMGILNLTPDSFYDGGQYPSQEAMLKQVYKMLSEGADIIDVGAVSTRPGAELPDEQEELKRLIPSLKLLIREFPKAVFSVDTSSALVARNAIDQGAMVINDVSGGTFDAGMLDFIASGNIPYVLMHTTGSPNTMMKKPIGSNVVEVVKAFFEKQLASLYEKGGSQIILDPGFGFGKTLEANYMLLRHISELRINGLPLLAGVSRKSMVNKVLNTKAEDALNGTTALHTLALMQGAQLLRVHDVKEAVEVVKICEKFVGG
jgi:dihydropteroate synthase